MEKNNLKSKKGQITDQIFVIATLVSIAITMVVAAYIYSEINDGFSESGLETNTSAKAYDDFEVAFGMFDKSFVFIVLVLTAGLIVSSFLIPTHPIFLVINIIGFLVLVFLGAVFSNMYVDVIAQEGLNVSAATYYPITTFFMSKLPFISAIIVLLSTIVMFAKGRQEE